jgi:hypothetical protein
MKRDKILFTICFILFVISTIRFEITNWNLRRWYVLTHKFPGCIPPVILFILMIVILYKNRKK